MTHHSFPDISRGALALLALALAFASPAHAQPRPPEQGEPAKAFLAATLDETAKSRIEALPARGFAGWICTDAMNTPFEKLTADGAFAARLQIVAAALKAVGGETGLVLTVPGFAACLRDPASLDKAAALTTEARMLAEAAGVSLLVLYCDTADPELHQGAKAYDWNAVPPDALSGNAYTLGQRLYGALTEGKGPEVCLAASDPVDAGPLWFPFVEGCGAAAKADETSLTVWDLTPCDTIAAFDDRGETIRRRLSALESGQDILLDRAVMAGRGDGGEAYPIRLLAAKLRSARRVWVMAPDALRGVVAATTPVDAMERVGPFTIEDADTYVLRDGSRGATLVLMNGAAKPFTTGASGETSVLNLDAGTTSAISAPAADGKQLAGPFDAPTLLTGLPMRVWAAPACLWAESRPAMDGGLLVIRFGAVNHTGFTLDGVFDAIVPKEFNLVPSRWTGSIAPGDSMLLESSLRGRASAGTEAPLTLQFAAGPDATMVRRFTLTTGPALAWRSILHSPLLGPAITADVDADGILELIAAARDGEILCCRTDGEMVWRRWIPETLTGPPLLVRRWTGEDLFLLQDERGGCSAYTMAGERIWRVKQHASRPSSPLLRIDLKPFWGDETVAAFDDGVVSVWFSTGYEYWSAVVGPNPRTAIVTLPGDGKPGVLVAHGGKSSGLALLAPDGNRLWRAKLRSTPNCPPTAFVGPDGRPLAAAGAGDALALFDLATGMPVNVVKPGVGILLALSRPEPAVPGVALCVVGGDGVAGIAPDGGLAWSIPIKGVTGASIASCAGTQLIAVGRADGGLTVLAPEGDMLWSAGGLADAPMSTPLITDMDGDGLAEIIAGAADFTLQRFSAG